MGWWVVDGGLICMDVVLYRVEAIFMRLTIEWVMYVRLPLHCTVQRGTLTFHCYHRNILHLRRMHIECRKGPTPPKRT